MKKRMIYACITLLLLVVEVLQYFRIVELLGFSDNRFLSILIGSVFDVKDVVCYGVGCVLFFFGEIMIKYE